MSRREFRASLADARPLAAFFMAAISTTILALTGQVAVWCLGAWLLCTGIAATFRTHPLGFQKSALLLNLGLAAATLSCGILWVQGALSLITLAHFATLALGLQLLDARPRRSEFLLVALALFQVILASNLTDSIFFSPLLIVFVLATVWTLLVHTLRTEALEAGEPASAQRVITPGLLRMTLLASGLSVLLALVLFLFLPRLRSSSLMSSPFGSSLSAAGFTDRVQLGDLGRIRQDPTVVLRVETLRGVVLPAREAYWRGMAFDAFDGQGWSVTPPGRERIAGVPVHGLQIPGPRKSDLVQRIMREPVASGVVFAAGRPKRLSGDIGPVARDHNGSLYAGTSVESRIRYTVETRTTRRDEASLGDDHAAPPSGTGDRFLRLPPLSAEVAELATDLTRGALNDAARSRRIEAFLLRTGRYTNTPPTPDPGASRTPVEVFLFEGLAGHCEYFASAFVVLARSAGIPSRLVNGFAGGNENVIGGFVELARSDAHAWAEVHYDDTGWVRYDPTPPDLRLRAPPGTSLAAHLGALASAAEHWWFKHVVDFDRSTQMEAIRTSWAAWQAWRKPSQKRPESPGTTPETPAAWLEAFGNRGFWAIAALGVLGVQWIRIRRKRRPFGARLPDAYRRALGLLSRRGLERGPEVTAREFASRVSDRFPHPAGEAFQSLTEGYLAERFGGQKMLSSQRELQRLRDSVAT